MKILSGVLLLRGYYRDDLSRERASSSLLLIIRPGRSANLSLSLLIPHRSLTSDQKGASRVWTIYLLISLSFACSERNLLSFPHPRRQTTQRSLEMLPCTYAELRVSIKERTRTSSHVGHRGPIPWWSFCARTGSYVKPKYKNDLSSWSHSLMMLGPSYWFLGKWWQGFNLDL